MALIQDYNKLYEQNSNIKKIYVNGNVVWPTKTLDYTVPLTIEMIENGSITISNPQGYTIKYQVNNESVVSSNSTTISINNLFANDLIKLYGNNVGYGASIPFSSTTITSSTKHNIYGNIMSLISETNFSTLTSFTTDYSFAYFFCQNTGLVNAKDLILRPTTLEYISPYRSMFDGCTSLTTAPQLPATTLADSCYGSMFSGCTSLTTAPALPATTLADCCYYNMFRGCTSLTTAPQLPATTLAGSCYESMFSGCTSLTSAPVLPATTLAEFCYGAMFRGCTSLNTIKCLATSGINVNYSTTRWLYNVSSTGTFTKAAGVTWPTGTSGIPSGWTVIDA